MFMNPLDEGRFIAEYLDRNFETVTFATNTGTSAGRTRTPATPRPESWAMNKLG